MADCQAEVSNGAHAVLLNQDILRLEVTMSNARLTCKRTDNTSLNLHQQLSRNSMFAQFKQLSVRFYASAVFTSLF